MACVRSGRLLAAVVMAAVLWAAPAMAQPQRVAILPFTAHAQGDASFLVQGVRDMLATRLAWPGKVQVLEPDLLAPAVKATPGPYDAAKAAQVGRELKADVVVFGSITSTGGAVSVDAQVVRPGEDTPALTTFVQAAGMDQVIPRINEFAQRINAEVFKRPEAVAALKKAQAATDEKYAGLTQEAAQGATVPEAERGPKDDLPANISPLNPLFLKSLSGVESDRYWRSPRIDGQINSLAVADIDLDGKQEVLALTQDSLKVYRLAGRHFGLIYEMKNGPKGEYLFVDTADLDGDGTPEIFVSNLNHYTIQSFVLRWQAPGGLAYVAKDLPYYFRAQPNPTGKGRIVLGQERDVADPYVGPIYQMKFKGGAYVPDKEISKPARWVNVFNLLLADLNGSGQANKVVVGLSWDLQVFSTSGKMLYQDNEVYNASSKTITAPPATNMDSQGWEDAWFFVPCRLLLSDLDNDKRSEVLAIRNADRMNELLGKMKAYYQGTIYSLYWNGMALVENWRTPRISGYVTDYDIGDVGNVGRPALVMAVNNRVMGGFASKDQAHFVAFTLKPKSEKTPQPMKEGL